MRAVDTLLVPTVALLIIAAPLACADGGAEVTLALTNAGAPSAGASAIVLGKGGSTQHVDSGHQPSGGGANGAGSDTGGNDLGGAGSDPGGSNGGSNPGGSATGGTNSGGSGNVNPSGGRSVGGSSAAGASTGGTGAGGKGSAGAATGGTSSGGSSGGSKGVAGSSSSGGSKGVAGSSSSGGSGSAGTSGVGLYTTDFNLTESPVSEGAKWKRSGLDWTQVVTANGYAFGTQTGNSGFNDSYAYLDGTFPANQSATAVIHLESGLSPYQEVELLLRWRDSAHNATGYECNLAYNGQYAEIIIWPGPLGTDKSQFKWVSSGNPVSGGVHDGDIFQADVIGNVITVRLNGKVIASGTDSSIPSGGAPGMGFYAEGAPASQKFSFSKFTGTGL